MIRAGIDRKVAMLTSCHKTESVFNRYNITNDRDIEDAIRKTDAYVAQLPSKREDPEGKSGQGDQKVCSKEPVARTPSHNRHTLAKSAVLRYNTRAAGDSRRRA